MTNHVNKTHLNVILWTIKIPSPEAAKTLNAASLSEMNISVSLPFIHHRVHPQSGVVRVITEIAPGEDDHEPGHDVPEAVTESEEF